MGGMPTNALSKGMEALTSRQATSGMKFLKDEIIQFNQNVKLFDEQFKDVPEAQPFIEDLKKEQATLPQFDGDVSAIIPENTQLVIEQVLSDGDWTKFDEETGAAGLYQFTEERWSEIMTLQPELGLTENGRVAKDPKQQEKAMEWALQDATRGLMAYDIPVTEANLLGTHKFGFDNFTAIYAAKDTDKLSTVLGEDAKNPVFKNFETVQSVKAYLSREVKKVK